MTAVVVALAATGVVLRAWVLVSELGVLDADEAVPGTMARHMLDGEFAAFYWGQGYGGTQETLLTAGLFALTGPSVEALRVAPIALFMVGALLTWRIGIRTVGEPYARLGAAVFWVWPAYVVWKSTRAHGFYGAAVVLSLVILLLTLRLAERTTRRDALLLGLALGLGLWATPQVLAVALPAVGWLVWQRREVLRRAWLVAGAAAVGSLPWLVSNLRNDWHSFWTPPRGGSAIDSIHSLLVATFPTALGPRLPFTLEWLGGAVLGAFAYAVILAALVWTLVRRRAELGPFVPVLALFPVFYALSPWSWLNTEPRYFVLISPLLALILVAAGGTAGRGVAIAGVLTTLSVAGVGVLDGRNVPAAYSDGVPVPADIDPLLRTLEAKGVRHGFADLWLGWRAVFESDEDILLVVPAEGRLLRQSGRASGDSVEQGRYPPFHEEVMADPDAAYVFLAGGMQEARLRPLLLEAGYRRLRTGDFIVYLRA